MTQYTRPTDSSEEINKWIDQQQELVAEFNRRFAVNTSASSIKGFRSDVQAYCAAYKVPITCRSRINFRCLHSTFDQTSKDEEDGKPRPQMKGHQKTNCQCHIKISSKNKKVNIVSSYGVHNHPVPYILPGSKYGRENVYEVQSNIVCMIKEEESVGSIMRVLASNNEKASRLTVENLIKRFNTLTSSVNPPTRGLVSSTSPDVSELSEISKQSVEIIQLKSDARVDCEGQRSDNVVEQGAIGSLTKQIYIPKRVLESSKIEKVTLDQEDEKAINTAEHMDITTDENIDSMMDYLLRLCKDDDTSKTSTSMNLTPEPLITLASEDFPPNKLNNNVRNARHAATNDYPHITSSYQGLNTSNTENQQYTTMVSNDNQDVIVANAIYSQMAIMNRNDSQGSSTSLLFTPASDMMPPQNPGPMVPTYSNTLWPQVPVYYPSQNLQAFDMQITNMLNNNNAVAHMAPTPQYYLPQNGLEYYGQPQNHGTRYLSYPYQKYGANNVYHWNSHL